MYETTLYTRLKDSIPQRDRDKQYREKEQSMLETTAIKQFSDQKRIKQQQ